MIASEVWDCNVIEMAEEVLEDCPEQIAFEDFAQYEILRLIDHGGMADVYLAEDTLAKRRVAIKFLRACWFETDRTHYFKREIETLAKLEHPYIARLYEAGVHTNGTPFIVMEYVEGKPLNAYCEGHAMDETLALFYSVCEAVQYAHSQAVIHLDLKHTNILVTEDGTPKLLDFGIAKQLEALDQPATQTQARYTPAFAAPEQLRRAAVGTYTDVYALGVILYELLAGKKPFEVTGSANTFEIESHVMSDRNPAPPSKAAQGKGASKSVWKDLDVLCLRAMGKDVRERYQSVLELMQDIERFRRHEPLRARPGRFTYRARKFLRRNRRAVGLSFSAVAIVTTLVVYYTVRLTEARDAAVLQATRTQRIQQFMLSMLGGDDYDAAPPADLRVVDVLQKAAKKAQLLKKEPSVEADLFETLGTIYDNLGDYGRAASLLTSSLHLREQVLGPAKPDTGESLVALSMLRIDQAQFGQAKDLARKALGIAQQNMPSAHRLLARSMIALGSAMEHSGEYRQAIPVLKQATYLLSNPDDKPDLINALTYLSNSYNLLGDVAQAEPLQRRVLSEDRQLYGDQHPGVAEDLSNLSMLEIKTGQYAEAEGHARRAVAIARAWYRKDNVEVELLREWLAQTLVENRKYDEASRLLSEALPAIESQLGPKHPFVAYGMNWSGVIALRRGELDEAEADFGRMQGIYSELFKGNERHLAITPLRFGELYAARQEYGRAEESFRRAVQLFSDSVGPEQPDTGTARVELGDTLLRQRRYSEAESELAEGYRILASKGGASTTTAIEAQHDLAAIQQARPRQ